MISYDPHNWRSHLFDIRGSMLREIFARVSVCVLWSILVVCVYRWMWPIQVPITAHSLVGIALGMLLVFRTNSSYDRFWEGRRMWGSIINESRNLGRAAVVYLRDDRELARQAIEWVSAYASASQNSLRGKTGLGPAGSRLPADHVRHVLAAGHVPLAVTTQLSGLLRHARDRGLVSDYVMIDLEHGVQRLIDYLGSCERIRSTPLPFAYMVHVRRALLLYCYTLPIALVETYGWATVIGTLLISYVFFGIEEIGVEIEDPFGRDENDLPLDKFCEMIDHNLQGLLANELDPLPPTQPVVA